MVNKIGWLALMGLGLLLLLHLLLLICWLMMVRLCLPKRLLLVLGHQ
jgi:hypothetical protein